MVHVQLETKPFLMELDTGASLSSISFDDYKNLQLGNKIFKTKLKMKTYTIEIIKSKGVCFLKYKYKSESFVGKLIIVNKKVDPIFYRDWVREVHLDWAEIKSLKATEMTH